MPARRFSAPASRRWRSTAPQPAFGLPGITAAAPFDPSGSYSPGADFFDNRTIYSSTQADLVVKTSARVSFDFGGDYFFTRRRSEALYGSTGHSGRADMQYRLSRFS